MMSNWNRRNFLKTAGMTTIGALGAGVVPACKQKYDGNHWWTQFNWKRVEKEIDSSDFRIEGHIPEELTGTYVRNGANNKNVDSNHYFVGDGMLHSLSLNEGNVQTYRNRWVQTSIIEKESPGTEISENESNTSVIYHGGKLMSLNEAGLPYVIGNSLSTTGAYDFSGKLETAMTAHPKIDPETGEMFFYGISILNKPHLHYYIADKDGQITSHETINIPAASMMHDFQITKNHVIFIDMPIVFDLPLAIAQQFPFKWKPRNGARIGVMPRYGKGAECQWFDIENCYMFHTINAFENPNNPNSITLEGCRMISMWENGVYDIYNRGYPYRWNIDLLNKKVYENLIDDRPADFGKVDQRWQGVENQITFVMPIVQMPIKDAAGSLKGVRKFDRTSGLVDEYMYEDHQWPDEHIFIPRSDTADEGDGWMMGFVYNAITDSSRFNILDTSSLSDGPVASILMPQRVPFGFHGTWIPGRNLF